MKLIHLPKYSDWGNADIIDTLRAHAMMQPGVNGKRLAAAIVHKQTLVYGHNSYKTSPLQTKYAENPWKVHLHAEIEALSRATRRCQGNINGAKAFVIRITKDCELASAKPCSGCMAALLEFGIKEVYYS